MTTIQNLKNKNQFIWQSAKSQYKITFETQGSGKPILLLPAFSTVCSRSEMKEIGEYLAKSYQVTALDWLGFGESERPKIDYKPEIYHQLLKDFVTNCFKEPIIIVVAGHAAGYALNLAQKCPDLVAKIVLIAPTWKGPLRVMGVSNNVRKALKNLVYAPIIGDFFYYLNTTPAFLRFMYRRHVYVNESILTPEFIQEKRKITQQKGARFAPVAFVTGHLDPVENREQFFSLISGLKQPILTIIGENSPPYSLSEMKALSDLKKVKITSLSGTLGMAEEYGQKIAPLIKEFLGA